MKMTVTAKVQISPTWAQTTWLPQTVDAYRPCNDVSEMVYATHTPKYQRPEHFAEKIHGSNESGLRGGESQGGTMLEDGAHRGHNLDL